MANKIIFFIIIILNCTISSYCQLLKSKNANEKISIQCTIPGSLSRSVDIIMIDKFLFKDTSKFEYLLSLFRSYKKVNYYSRDKAKKKLGVSCEIGLFKLELRDECYLDIETLQLINKI